MSLNWINIFRAVNTLRRVAVQPPPMCCLHSGGDLRKWNRLGKQRLPLEALCERSGAERGARGIGENT